jgi:hypothetical protein
VIDPTGTPTLAELLFHAERFCVKVESASNDHVLTPIDRDELRLKIGQARNIAALLQQAYNDDELSLARASVRANYRYLIVSLLWVAFYGRQVLDFRTYRMLVLIESSYTLLLNTHR